MKNKAVILTILFAALSILTKAQDKDTLRIKTSAVCNECKEIIERYLSFEKGVDFADLDVTSKMVTIIYNPQKTDPQHLRIAVTKSGYDADTLKADPKAFRKLPECCKKPHGE